MELSCFAFGCPVLLNYCLCSLIASTMAHRSWHCASTVGTQTPAPTVCTVPALVMEFATEVIEHCVSDPKVSHTAPTPVTEYVAPARMFDYTSLVPTVRAAKTPMIDSRIFDTVAPFVSAAALAMAVSTTSKPRHSWLVNLESLFPAIGSRLSLEDITAPMVTLEQIVDVAAPAVTYTAPASSSGRIPCSRARRDQHSASSSRRMSCPNTRRDLCSTRSGN